MKNVMILWLLVFSFTMLTNQILCQDFLLQGWYWNYPGTEDGHLWADTLEARAQSLAQAGFTHVWLPPLSRASFGSSSNGYDPQDLYDLGEEYGGGATRFGTRTDVDNVVAACATHGIKAVADVVYNHRDGGRPEKNTAVEGWIENYNWTKCQNGDNAYPSDRFRCILPIGGSTGRGTGTYYFKIKSASEHDKFYNKAYKAYMWTNAVGWQNVPDVSESEPNGGGGCGEPNNTITLGRNMLANIDAMGCKIDEFALTLNAGDFETTDTLFISLMNLNGDYSDHYVYELWYNSSNIQGSIEYQTFTDFTKMPSGLGGMNYMNFKPNGNPTQLAGDWDWMWFFYDYDQYVQTTKDVLWAWTSWLWTDVGIRGLRMDAVKHFSYEFVGDLLDNLHDNSMDPTLVVGEFYDGNAFALKSWLDNVKANMDADTKAAIQPRVFDFALRDALKNACDTFGNDVRTIFTSGLVDAAGASGFDAITFVGNHDFRDPGQYVENDPILPYAYILTNNQIGLPCVFYKDYINGGLQTRIDSLLAVHKKYIYGAFSRDYLSRSGSPYAQSFSSGYDHTTILYQLMNTPLARDVFVGINFAGEPLNVTHGVNMASLSSGDILVDVLGRSGTGSTTMSGNAATFKLPARDYSVWVKGVQAKCKIMLEGPYDPDTNEMNTTLNLAGDIPTISPFAQDPRRVSSIPDDIVDWVLLELRSIIAGESLAARSVFLHKDGRLLELDGQSEIIGLSAAPGDYHLIVRHRNHLAAASAAPIALTSNSATLYDFTIAKSQYYNADATLLDADPVRYGLYAGDADGNGQVQNSDKNDFWRNQTGLAGYHSADFSVNGQVQNDDKNDFWKLNVGKGTHVP
ncbi:hypothetical protein JXA70_07345 [candidate division KSB1 bacterium]|nr:hypothetical protein [candidate division KSB1 bacterium]